MTRQYPIFGRKSWLSWLAWEGHGWWLLDEDGQHEKGRYIWLVERERDGKERGREGDGRDGMVCLVMVGQDQDRVREGREG